MPLDRLLVFARLTDGERSGAGVRRTVEFATGFMAYCGVLICRSSIFAYRSSLLSDAIGGAFSVGAFTVSNTHPSSSSFGEIVALSHVSA